MSRSERLLKLLQVLRRRSSPVSGHVLAVETGVSIRTLYRDIASLQAQGAGFYQGVFGGASTVVTYQDAGNVRIPAEADHLMWGLVAADSGRRCSACSRTATASTGC